MIEPIVKRCAGLDVHKMVIVATVLTEQPDGEVVEITRKFKTFKKDRLKLCRFLKEHKVELVVMESTGIYWKSLFMTLEKKGIKTQVVNARHAKNVPGRKTDVTDSQWLASLARNGLLRPSFIPEKDLRELRLISRQRKKLKQTLAAEKNRLHKTLDDAGIRLGGVVSDINGVSARAIIAGLINKEPVDQLMGYVKGRLREKIEELRESVDEDLSERHRFLLSHLHEHIEHLEDQIDQLDSYLFEAMNPYKEQWEILQTIPGVDKVAAATLIIEMGVDMEHFKDSSHLASWAGMCPGNNESAGKKKAVKPEKGTILSGQYSVK